MKRIAISAVMMRLLSLSRIHFLNNSIPVNRHFDPLLPIPKETPKRGGQMVAFDKHKYKDLPADLIERGYVIEVDNGD